MIVCLLLTITGKMEAEKFTVYCNTELEAGATKRVAKALVDCKVRMYVSNAALRLKRVAVRFRQGHAMDLWHTFATHMVSLMFLNLTS